MRDPKDYKNNAEFCPACETNLQGDPIDTDKQYMYGATNFSRKIGIYSMEKDSTVEWACPDCNHRWDR
jgi:hypothetical protein